MLIKAHVSCTFDVQCLDIRFSRYRQKKHLKVPFQDKHKRYNTNNYDILNKEQHTLFTIST